MPYQLYIIEGPNGKSYIGLTSRKLSTRWAQHRRDARKGSVLPFHCAIRKYGPTAFIPRTLVIGSREYIRNLEGAAIKVFGARISHNGYNVAAGGVAPMHSPETIEIIRLSSTGRRHTEEAKKKISDAHLGSVRPPEYRAKISAALTGRKTGPRHPEICAKISAAQKGIKKGPLSDETRAKMSASRMGRIISLEHREKISAALKGRTISGQALINMSLCRVGKKRRPLSDEHKANIAAAKTGFRHSEETKQKISASKKKILA